MTTTEANKINICKPVILFTETEINPRRSLRRFKTPFKLYIIKVASILFSVIDSYTVTVFIILFYILFC